MPHKHHSIAFFLGAGTVLFGAILVLLPTVPQLSSFRSLSPFHALASDGSLTLESVFSTEKPITPDVPWDATTTILATGDVSLGRTVNAQTVRKQDNLWPFRNVLELLNDSTITVINLEAQLTKNCPILNDGMRLCGGQHHAEGLAAAGIDIANVANNHAGDFGAQGLQDSLELLQSNQIAQTGTGSPVYFSSKGTVFAFLGYNAIPPKTAGISWAVRERMVADIQTAKQFADVVIVQLHWGVEYQAQPSSAQVELGRFLLDSGADAILGHHPHWVQPMEIYNEKPIFYSLGNFIFDQEWSQKTKEGMVAKLTYQNKKLTNIQLIPVDLYNFGQVQEVRDPKSRKKRLDDMLKQSKLLLQTYPQD